MSTIYQGAYCVYFTFYSGNKLPPFYIGSSYVDKVIDKNYHGSVSSKKYKDIWKSELKENPHLFKTRILSIYDSRQDATNAENRLQKKLSVVKSTMYINQSFAQINGFAGMDVKGENNPRFGKIMSQETKDKIGKANRNKRHSRSAQYRQKLSNRLKGYEKTQEHLNKLIAKILERTKTYIIIWPIEGTNKPDPNKSRIETINNLNEFCRQNSSLKLDSGHMSKVAKNKSRHHKGFVVQYA